MDDEIRTIPLSLESTINGIAVSIPWAQRQANGAVILRVHMQAPRYSAGELLLNEGDLIALDPDERPLRTQVRRFWGYTALSDVTAAHLQTARFDVGFRLDLLASRGQGGLSISIIRTFRPGEGPKAVGGPWVFKFRVVDENEIASLARSEAARIEAAQREQAQREQMQRDVAERDAAQREAARLARARAEAERGGPLRTDRLQPSSISPSSQSPLPINEGRREPYEGYGRPDRGDGDEYAAGRGRRPSRFGRRDSAGRDDSRRDVLEPPHTRQSQPVQAPLSMPPASPVEPPPPAAEPSLPAPEQASPSAPVSPVRATASRSRGPRSVASAANRTIEDAVMGPAETALEAVGERPRALATDPAQISSSDHAADDVPSDEKPAARARTTRPAAPRRAPRATVRKSGSEDEGGPSDSDP